MTQLDRLEVLLAGGTCCEVCLCNGVCEEVEALRQLLAVARAADNLPDWLPEDAHVGIQAVKDNAGEIWMEIMRLRTDLAPLERDLAALSAQKEVGRG